MKFRAEFRRALSMAPHIVVRKVAARGWKRCCEWLEGLRDAWRPSYLAGPLKCETGLRKYIRSYDTSQLGPWAKQIYGVSRLCVDHKFDLLGSGWIKASHGVTCRGVEGVRYNDGAMVKSDRNGEWLVGRINRSNLDEARRIWHLVDEHYEPIDWQRDLKSGFRWREQVLSNDLSYGEIEGVDVKFPWELARMQHLVQFAWAYMLAAEKEDLGFGSPDLYLREFRNEILDFAATNPPRYGVNWKCAMDVAIRAVNWLLAYDLLRCAGAELDEEFRFVLERSILEHATFIAENLEWHPDVRANHYLADVAGLLILAAYLPCTPLVDVWLAFGVQELIKECERQFHEDGGNFEGSSCYHRLSGEMVVYASAYVLGLDAEKREALKSYDARLFRGPVRLHTGPMAFHGIPGSDAETPLPSWMWSRLEGLSVIGSVLRNPDGRMPQVGDNDNGRLLKLFPAYRRLTTQAVRAKYENLEGYQEAADSNDYWLEDHLDHGHLLATGGRLCGRKDLEDMAGPWRAEASIVAQITGGREVPRSYRKQVETVQEPGSEGEEPDEYVSRFRGLSDNCVQRYEFSVEDGDHLTDMQVFAFDSTGFYLLRSSRLYLLTKCGPLGQGGNGGHDHNDQLSVEMWLDEEPVIRDPGTYLYTPAPVKRNAYRSVRAHFAPQLEKGEPAGLNDGLFRISADPRAECLHFSARGFVGRHSGYGAFVWRIICIRRTAVEITDVSEGEPLRRLPVPFLGRCAEGGPPPYSDGYGWVQRQQ